ncbi:hypothetical protein [Salipaludibacillus aurantiacus]|uniref:PDZ domain-containing protein n=1 Tax=Salipaludibacillus aurantiacus TaxID=1601833 RepID=A0A1H9WXB7_9BACI|nr:hypothetical protein [Salipaludibacillus aurantiacus]SES38578.1 hypothetical protein SAMN05518684_12112 [Salipaludibacillus aurantiacus]
MEAIGFEVLKALGRFFMHPLTYVFIIAIFWFGLMRVKRERKDFHTRVEDVIQQLTSPLPAALITAVCISGAILLLGLEMPAGMLILWSLFWLILLPFRNARWLSMTAAGSLALLIAPFLPSGGTDFAFLNQWLGDIEQMNLLNAAWLLAILFLAETLLVLSDGWKQTSPAIVKSKRGKLVGEHMAQRLWFLPLFIIFPAGEISGGGWWPVVELTGGQTFGLALFPFLLSFQARIYGEYARDGVKKIGKHYLLLNLAVLACAAAAYYYPLFIFAVPAAVLIGKEVIYYLYKSADQRRISMFTRREKGLKILGILPHSTAAKMELLVGEIIVKTNGREVNSQRDFYDALQQNPAYCKLEVKNLHGELRFPQSSVFEKDHYQIGCLFVPDDEYGNLSSRALRSSVVINQDRAELGESEERGSSSRAQEADFYEDSKTETNSVREDEDAVSHEDEAAASVDHDNNEEEPDAGEDKDKEPDPEAFYNESKRADESAESREQAPDLAAFYREFREAQKAESSMWETESEEEDTDFEDNKSNR